LRFFYFDRISIQRGSKIIERIIPMAAYTASYELDPSDATVDKLRSTETESKDAENEDEENSMDIAEPSEWLWDENKGRMVSN
jgi:hypothetical protein